MTTPQASSAEPWMAPRLVSLGAARGAAIGKVENLTELEKTGTPGITVKYGYGPS